ncbi:hypothetical protein [Hoeflea sp.]
MKKSYETPKVTKRSNLAQIAAEEIATFSGFKIPPELFDRGET